MLNGQQPVSMEAYIKPLAPLAGNPISGAVQDLLSTDYTRQALATSIVAEVAANYFLLRDLDNRLDIARLTLVGRKESTRINAERFAKGYAPELDQLQAQQQELFAAAVIPSFKRQIYQV
jgi:multidrug efflux system outer membrane protein